MKKITLILTLLTLSFNTVSSQTVFGFETATDTGATITETIDGITVTLSGDPDLELLYGNGFGGTSGNVALTQNTITSVTFTFSQPVVVNSIIPIEVNGATVDYTYTPTGGSNEPVTASIISGASESSVVNLNWVNVTAFTVTASGAKFGFDDLSVDTGTNGQTFFEWETANNAGGTITETVNGIGVTVSGDSSYSLTDYGGASGTSGNVILSNANRTSITFTFGEPVAVNSILALEGTGANIDYTFTPTGGNNSPVTKSLVSGVTAVSLNWVGVTGFTVTSSGGAFGFDNLSVTGMDGETLFGIQTATEYQITDPAQYCGSNIKYYTVETIDGITITLTSENCRNVIKREEGAADYSNTDPDNNKCAVRIGDLEPIIVTFSEPVVVNSLNPYMDGFVPPTDPEVDYTFTPIGGNNSPVTITLDTSEAGTLSSAINLNWIGVTAFIITPSTYVWIGFDNLSVNALKSLGVDDNHKYKSQNATIYPNPVTNTLYIKNVSDLKSISLYNVLGQQVLQSKDAIIDMGGLSKGLYLLQINTDHGTETKKIVKK